jgi:Zincin-like metallopeptidase
VLWLLPAQECLDDAHAASAARVGTLWCFWFLGLGVGRLDGIDWDEGNCEQFADTCDIAGAGLAGISMPAFEAFKGADHFYCTEFHELTHWTGHKSRLARDLKNRFGSRDYAAEELVAKLGAAFLCAEFGFDGDVRHAGYIATWIELLKADKRALFTACSKDSQAADYLRGLALAEAAPIAA